MKLHAYIILSITALFSWTSCQRDLDVPLPEHKKRLVVNSFITAQQTLDLYLSRSYGPLEDVDKLDLYVKDAEVKLLNKGESIATLTMSDTTITNFDWFTGDSITKTLVKYSSTIPIEGGETYQIEVSHPDYESISAETLVPHQAEISNAELIQNAGYTTDIDGYKSYQSMIKLNIQDMAGIGNHYRIKVAIEMEDPWQPDQFYVQELWDYEGGPVTGRDNTGGYLTDGPWLSDTGMDGQNIPGEFIVMLPNAYDQDQGVDPTPLNIRKVFVQLFNANDDSYEYLRKLKQQEDNASNGFDFFPPEAIVVTSNIKNGYGIFGGMSITEMEFVP